NIIKSVIDARGIICILNRSETLCLWSSIIIRSFSATPIFLSIMLVPLVKSFVVGCVKLIFGKSPKGSVCLYFGRGAGRFCYIAFNRFTMAVFIAIRYFGRRLSFSQKICTTGFRMVMPRFLGFWTGFPRPGEAFLGTSG